MWDFVLKDKHPRVSLRKLKARTETSEPLDFIRIVTLSSWIR